MATTISIPKGNDFQLFFPLVLLTDSGKEPLHIAELTDIHVVVAKGQEQIEYDYNYEDTLLYVQFEETLERATYDVHITAKYNGRDIASHLKACFKIVDWNKDANIENHFPKEEYTAETSVFIGYINTDQDLESIKADYRDKLQAAEQARQEYETAKSNFDKETLQDIINAAKDEIKEAISNGSCGCDDIEYVTEEDIDALF